MCVFKQSCFILSLFILNIGCVDLGSPDNDPLTGGTHTAESSWFSTNENYVELYMNDQTVIPAGDQDGLVFFYIPDHEKQITPTSLTLASSQNPITLLNNKIKISTSNSYSGFIFAATSGANQVAYAIMINKTRNYLLLKIDMNNAETINLLGDKFSPSLYQGQIPNKITVEYLGSDGQNGKISLSFNDNLQEEVVLPEFHLYLKDLAYIYKGYIFEVQRADLIPIKISFEGVQ